MSTTARVRVDPQPLWRLRLSVGLTRWLVQALAVAGIAASLRFAIAPPLQAVHAAPRYPAFDLGAASVAQSFARSYLTWDAATPTAHQQALASFLGGGADPDAGMRPPPRGAQRVLWTDVVADRPLAPGEHIYTVAAGIDPGGVIHLAVDVIRHGDGTLSIGRYPGIVGGVTLARATTLDTGDLPGVTDGALSAVAERALGNYLQGSTENLSADVVPGVDVATPDQRLALEQIEGLKQLGPGAVLATVSATTSAGATYTLTYELGVIRHAGRWEITSVESAG